MKKLREIKLPKGSAYAGRCAGGNGRDYGGQYLIVAADEDVLARVWEALEHVELKRDITYSVATIDAARLEKMLESPHVREQFLAAKPEINEVR